VKLPVVLRPAAAAEIEDAYRWYEKEKDGLGAEFLIPVFFDRFLENGRPLTPMSRLAILPI